MRIARQLLGGSIRPPQSAAFFITGPCRLLRRASKAVPALVFAFSHRCNSLSTSTKEPAKCSAFIFLLLEFSDLADKRQKLIIVAVNQLLGRFDCRRIVERVHGHRLVKMAIRADNVGSIIGHSAALHPPRLLFRFGSLWCKRTLRG